MKNAFFLFFFIPFLFSCDAGTINYKNPNLPSGYPVNFQVDMNLPTNYYLQFPNNYIVDYGRGIMGVVVFNAGSNYVAFDLACPNIPYTSCTQPMSVSTSTLQATCGCDSSTYSLFSGQSQTPGKTYTMKPYRVEQNGNLLTITN